MLQGTGGLFRQVVVNVLEDLSHMVGQRILLEVSGLKISRENDLPEILQDLQNDGAVDAVGGINVPDQRIFLIAVQNPLHQTV